GGLVRGPAPASDPAQAGSGEPDPLFIVCADERKLGPVEPAVRGLEHVGEGSMVLALDRDIARGRSGERDLLAPFRSRAVRDVTGLPCDAAIVGGEDDRVALLDRAGAADGETV